MTGPQHDVTPFLTAADMFCLPSLYDSFPNAVLEALCCALPVIVTDAVGIANAVTKYNAGTVCEKEASSIANALQRVWKNKDEMSKNALKLSLNYDLTKASELWLNLYNTLINQKKVGTIAHPSH